MHLNIDQFEKWYRGQRPVYESLCESLQNTIQILLKQSSISCLPVSGRTKKIDSAVRKAKGKSYSNPSVEMHDLCGIRIVTLVESDIEKVCVIVKSAFNVHADKSVDKITELKVDQFGYRSVHYVCDLGVERFKLAENAGFAGLLFEIQIRTVLQHAWAEIDHDRNYKFSGLLPSTLQRRLYLIAGTLELADRELNSLAAEIDNYANSVMKKTESGDLSAPIDSVSLSEYLSIKHKSFPGLPWRKSDRKTVSAMAVQELLDFGLRTLADLDTLFDKGFVEALERYGAGESDIGILRDAMMWHDVEGYLNKAWKKHWDVWDPETKAMLITKYGKKLVESIASEYELDVVGPDYD